MLLLTCGFVAFSTGFSTGLGSSGNFRVASVKVFHSLQGVHSLRGCACFPQGFPQATVLWLTLLGASIQQVRLYAHESRIVSPRVMAHARECLNQSPASYHAGLLWLARITIINRDIQRTLSVHAGLLGSSFGSGTWCLNQRKLNDSNSLFMNQAKRGRTKAKCM